MLELIFSLNGARANESGTSQSRYRRGDRDGKRWNLFMGVSSVSVTLDRLMELKSSCLILELRPKVIGTI